MVGKNTDEAYRRYAIVDESMIRDAAIKINPGVKFGERLQNDLHNRISPCGSCSSLGIDAVKSPRA